MCNEVSQRQAYLSGAGVIWMYGNKPRDFSKGTTANLPERTNVVRKLPVLNYFTKQLTVFGDYRTKRSFRIVVVVVVVSQIAPANA